MLLEGDGQQGDARDGTEHKTGNIYGKMRREGRASGSPYTDEAEQILLLFQGCARSDSRIYSPFFLHGKADAHDNHIGSKHQP